MAEMNRCWYIWRLTVLLCLWQVLNYAVAQNHERWRRQIPELPNITGPDLQEAILNSEAVVNRRLSNVQPEIYKAGAQHAVGTADWFMAGSHQANSVTKNLTRVSLISEEATRYLSHKFELTREQIAYSLPNLDIRGSVLSEACPLKVDFPCQPRKYRAYNGYCNNVQHPHWGSANMRYLRYLMPHYGDGVSFPRMASDGDVLPSARSVSLGIHRDSDKPHAHLMVLTAAWGEFISHDLVHTSQMTGHLGSFIKCCGIKFDHFHPECYPIGISEEDPYYSKLGDRCQEYARTSVAPRVGCTLGPREQANQASAFLDASNIYGTSKEKSDELRLFQGGLLRTQAGPGGELLPSDRNTKYCRSNAGGFRCFKSGDDRVNEHLGLAGMHTLWLREHNRIARQLAAVNPDWPDEILFQETRRIIAAEIQHITYNEFLPVVLGESVVSHYGLKPQTSGFFKGYDINVNTGVFNAVATAAIWFFASLMPKTMAFYDTAGRKVAEKNIGESFYAPFDLYRDDVLDQLLRGLLRGKAQSEDQFINEVMTNKMFLDPKTGRGLDLAAQLIQQGRDHGLPGYVFYRQLCGFGRVNSFVDLNVSISTDVIESLQRIYKSVEDIDLFTGALAELSVEGAVTGPTIGCLLGIQFQKLKQGDRFWYENDLPPSAFSADQLQEIRKVTLARIICDNSKALEETQPSVFLDRDPFLNAPMHCSGDAIRRIDYKKWANEQPESFFPSKKVAEAIRSARQDVRSLQLQQQSIAIGVDPLSPAGTAFGFNKPKPQALEIANASFLLQFATTRFLKGIFSQGGELQDREASPSSNREVREILSALSTLDISGLTEIPKNQKCGEHDLPCDHTSKFRSISGWCNNLQDPERGKAFLAFKRMLPADYNDGFQEPRQKGVVGKPLPSARLVSTQIHDDISVPHQRYTLLVMQYAQLLDHDLTHTPMNKGPRNTILDCHGCDAKDRVHPECWPIQVPKGDPYFPAINRTSSQPHCLPFTRSLPGQLTLGVREQLNQVTAYVDASHTYGSDVCEAKKLRSFSGGQLNVTVHPWGRNLKPLLPQTPDNQECKSPTGLCFEAGDLRSSEQPALAAMHTIFLREHNRIASDLHGRNPHWDDELVYQTSRKILGAMTQHLTYGEFLPRILGWDTINKYNLELLAEGFSDQYDSSCDATIFNEFAAAAFRFGHSLLKPSFKRFAANLQVKEPSVQLRHTFFNPDVLFRPGMIDEIMFGLANTPMETLDTFITEEVTNHLFENRRNSFSGMDLAALNIQRAREHGIPGYNQYREICNMTRATTFEDLKKEIPYRLIEKFRKVYEFVDDIDLFPGGLAETPVHGGIVGPTFACIIAKQFIQLKKCDRFWYENSEPLTRFTEGQLTEIRKASFSRLLCDNADDTRIIQRSALDVPEPFLNPRVPCSSLPQVDLDAWTDRKDHCQVGDKSIPLARSDRISPCVMCTCTKEGPMCQSMRIDNCLSLSAQYSALEIFNDHVCKVQCAFSFRLFSQSLNSVRP